MKNKIKLAHQILLGLLLLILASCQSNEQRSTEETMQESFELEVSKAVILNEDSIPELEANENLDYIPSSNITQTNLSKIKSHTDNDSIEQAPRILMLGDSHLMGPFGEHLQRAIHNTGKFDILSISIAGAGSKTYTYKLTNSCCGYSIRESLHDEIIPKNKKIRYLEYNPVQSVDIVSKKHNGRLSTIVSDIQPDIVLIALGNNFVNDHQGLINIIRENASQSEIVWIGPMRRTKLGMRIKAIQNTVDRNNIFFVRSDDVIGHDTITTTHFYGKEASIWANTIFSRIEPLLNKFGEKIEETIITD